MKKPFHSLLFLLLGTSLTVFAQSNRDEIPYRTQTFSGSLNTVRVETLGGSIGVEGGQASGVKVDMYIRSSNSDNKLSKEEIEDRLKEYDIVLTTEGETVVATAKRKLGLNWTNSRLLTIAFRVYTPRNFATNLHTSGGSIQISHLTGNQDFATSGGSLTITDVEGSIKGRTSGGSVRVTDCKKDIDVATSGGSIIAENSNGNLNMRTSGGSLRLNGLKGKIDAHTSGGSVTASDIDGELIAGTSGGSVRLTNIAGSVEASTSGGGIDADISRVGGYVRLIASSGSVHVRMPLNKGLDLDLSGNRVSIPLTNFNGTYEKDHVRGSLNGGGVPVRISSGSGSVSVNQ